MSVQGRLCVLRRVRSYEAQAEAAELFLQAVEEAEGDREILAVAHDGVAACLFRLRERLVEGVEHAELAARLAIELGDHALAAEALSEQLLIEMLLGRETAAATTERALALQEATEDRRVLAQPLAMAAVRWWSTDALERARDTFLEMLQRSRHLGGESSHPYVFVLLGQVECIQGNLESARVARSRVEKRQNSQGNEPARVPLALRVSSRRGAAESSGRGQRHSALSSSYLDGRPAPRARRRGRAWPPGARARRSRRCRCQTRAGRHLRWAEGVAEPGRSSSSST